MWRGKSKPEELEDINWETFYLRRSYFYCLPEMSIVTQVTFSGLVIAPFIIVWLKETFKGSSIWRFWQVAMFRFRDYDFEVGHLKIMIFEPSRGCSAVRSIEIRSNRKND